MGKKMIAKVCPKCEQQRPVACKTCPCGHLFFPSRKTPKVDIVPSDPIDFRRRTQRVRREKPNYYDALEYDKQIKKMKLKLNANNQEDNENGPKPKKKRSKREEDYQELINNLSPEKQLQCSLILEELNRKMKIVMWKPSD